MSFWRGPASREERTGSAKARSARRSSCLSPLLPVQNETSRAIRRAARRFCLTGLRDRVPSMRVSSDAPNSELRTAIDADGIAGDPTRVLRGEERHNRADITGLADPLERLHAENEGLALVGLDEVRHVGV